MAKRNARDMLDNAVRGLIIIFIFVFDPLAVLLLVAANVINLELEENKRRTKLRREICLQTMTKKYDRLLKRQTKSQKENQTK